MFKQILKKKILSEMKSLDKNDIYAISFLINFNESDDSDEELSLPNLFLLYNTEAECEADSEFDEERWNIAFWQEEEFNILESNEKNELVNSLLRWYKQIGVENIGYEDEEEMYDDKMEYIGKGPNGYWELASLLSEIACEIHSEEPKFSKIPIIINDYEYSWYTYDFTESANPDGQAKIFLKAYKELFE